MCVTVMHSNLEDVSLVILGVDHMQSLKVARVGQPYHYARRALYRFQNTSDTAHQLLSLNGQKLAIELLPWPLGTSLIRLVPASYILHACSAIPSQL